MPPRSSLSALEVEEFLDLLRYGGHDGGVEECIETCKQECADYDGNEDLHSGVDVAFSSYVLDSGLGADRHSDYLGLKIGEKLFHFNYLILS